MKHTPGPWHWINPDNDSTWNGETDRASLRTIKKYGKNETKIINGDSYTSFALPKFVLDSVEGIENLADAHLIAAAPDILAALESAIKAMDYAAGCGHVTHGATEEMRAALKRAKGET